MWCACKPKQKLERNNATTMPSGRKRLLLIDGPRFHGPCPPMSIRDRTLEQAGPQPRGKPSTAILSDILKRSGSVDKHSEDASIFPLVLRPGLSQPLPRPSRVTTTY